MLSLSAEYKMSLSAEHMLPPADSLCVSSCVMSCTNSFFVSSAPPASLSMSCLFVIVFAAGVSRLFVRYACALPNQYDVRWHRHCIPLPVPGSAQAHAAEVRLPMQETNRSSVREHSLP